MSKSRTVRLVAKVNAEVVVHLHPAVLRVDVDDEHHGALGGIVIFPTLRNILGWRKKRCCTMHNPHYLKFD